MASIFGLGAGQIILIVVVVLVISLIFFKRYFKALMYDYVVDGGLSFLDEPLGGIGMFDWGDWIAAFLIFRKYKKIVGVAIALILVLEAANFIPGLDYMTNIFPAVTIAMLFFSKFKPAIRKEKELEEEISLAERIGIKVSKEKKVLKNIKKLIKKSDPVGALKLIKSKKPIKEIHSELRDYVNNLISDTQNIIQYIVKQNIQAPQHTINILQQGINQAGELMQGAEQQIESAKEEKDFEAAINAAASANNIIRSAAQQFDNEFREWQNELQQQGQLQPGYAH
jgi:hypothetical protein